MLTTFVNLRTVFTAAVIGTMTVFAAPRTAAAQGPSGSYQKSCRTLSVSRDGIMTASCQTTNGKWNRTSIRVSDCSRGDIANSDGRLVCMNTSGNGAWRNGRGNDNHGYSHRNDRGRESVVLFTGTRFRGRSMSVNQDYTNLGTTGFNDAAESVRVSGGTWRLCTDKQYGGRCVNVSSDVSDLSSLGIRSKISSIRQVQ